MPSVARSVALLEQAKKVMPGGVNSPVRSFRSVGGHPIFFKRGEGAYLYSTDNQRYIDYVCSWGAVISGHAHPAIVQSVTEAVQNGLGFGATTEVEVRFAERLCGALPNLEKVRLVSSGTEATMSAIRLARGFTQRHKLVKFGGCYHGHSDALLVAAGSGAQALGIPDSSGVTAGSVADTLVLPYNDSEALEQCFRQQGDTIAAVIIEPIAGNMNMVVASTEFIKKLRELCHQFGTVLIFDEVMSGFRVGAGGAQGLLGVVPDITCLGKVIGGGLAVAAFGGRADIMAHLAPLGAVYQAGTLSGNPVALAAGMAVLDIILNDNFYRDLHRHANRLAQGLSEAAAGRVPFCAQAIGGMWGYYFLPAVPTSFAAVKEGNMAQFKQFFHAMLDRGVYFAPSAFEAGFIGSAHTDAVIDETIAHAKSAFAEL